MSPAVELTDIGAFRFSYLAKEEMNPVEMPDGLSGIVYTGDDHYLAVSDRHACLHRITIQVNTESGEIRSAHFEAPLLLRDNRGNLFPEPGQGPDREGVIYDPAAGAVWISNERTGTDWNSPSIARYALDTGLMNDLITMKQHPQLGVFDNIIMNQGFEALTRNAEGNRIWTANEQALTVDGSAPTISRGTVVRLQQFDGGMHPMAQYAYKTDPIEVAITAPPALVNWRISGVADLAALNGGALLVLERAVVGDESGLAMVRIRIYEVDFTNATDISRSPWSKGLLTADRPFRPVGKRRLIELTGGKDFAFEGMTVGPRLDNGDYSLILIADNDTGPDQILYALRLHTSHH